MSDPRIAIAGATGAVGHEFLRVLTERNFPLRSLKLLASARSAGQELTFRGEQIVVEELREDSFTDVDVAFFSAGGGISKQFGPKAVESGAIVIDNSSAFRMQDGVPLVVPEVNAHALKDHQGLIANPNCSTIILVLALQPLHAACGLKSVVVSTYQAASGGGQAAVDELFAATRAALSGVDAPAPKAMPQSLAFNLFPHVDVFQDSGYTKEEDKMLFEVQKIMGLPALPVDATCVRVPVERSHSEAVQVALEKPISVEDARALFASAPGVELLDDPSEHAYPMPRDYAGKDAIGVGRIRHGRVFDPGLTFWIVGDQLKKGAALNAVQIAEALGR